MASNIEPSNIDGTYPVAGQDNSSQGMRDNFVAVGVKVVPLDLSCLREEKGGRTSLALIVGRRMGFRSCQWAPHRFLHVDLCQRRQPLPGGQRYRHRDERLAVFHPSTGDGEPSRVQEPLQLQRQSAQQYLVRMRVHYARGLHRAVQLPCMGVVVGHAGS